MKKNANKKCADYADLLSIRHAQLPKLLSEFDELCNKNHIKYSLGFGTLIGAIRHKGFIPWDDDIDIIMDRNNFNKLMKLIRKSSKYEISRGHWVRMFKRKSDKFSIDLFPFDNVPDNKIKAKIKLILLKVLQGMIDKKKDITRFPLVYRFAIRTTSFFGKLFSLNTKQHWYDRAMVIGNKKRTKKISAYGCSFNYLSVYQPCNLFKEYVKVDFEGEKYSAVKNYDLFLRSYYGDYMAPPDISQQIPSHIQL